MIAKAHLDVLDKELQPVPDVWLDHAMLVTLLSATAIEAELNQFIAMHGLAAENKQAIRFFGILLSRHYRTGATDKINLVQRVYPSIFEKANLRKRINDVIKCRNKIVHPQPQYHEIALRRPQKDPITGEPLLDEAGEALFKEIPPQPVWIGAHLDGQEVSRCFEHFASAVELIQLLSFPRVEPNEAGGETEVDN